MNEIYEEQLVSCKVKVNKNKKRIELFEINDYTEALNCFNDLRKKVRKDYSIIMNDINEEILRDATKEYIKQNLTIDEIKTNLEFHYNLTVFINYFENFKVISIVAFAETEEYKFNINLEEEL